jgi:hypothetical protein
MLIKYKFLTFIKRLYSINYNLLITLRSILIIKNIMLNVIKALKRNSFNKYIAKLTIKVANVYSSLII